MDLNNIYSRLLHKNFENKNFYVDKIKNIINNQNLKNSYISINDFKNLSKYLNNYNNINNNINTNNEKNIIKNENLYNSLYEKQLEITKNLDYDFIFDKIKELIFEEIYFYI